MKSKISILLIIAFLLMGCSSSKIEATPQQVEALDELVSSRSFSITSEYAFPLVTNSLSALQNSRVLAPGQNPGRISLFNNSNALTINGEFTTSKLPYFGEIQQSSGYNGSDNSIEFNGKTKDYQAIKNSNNTYTIKYSAKSKGENFDVTITLFPGLKSELFVKGNKRFPIRYTGSVSALQEDSADKALKK